MFSKRRTFHGALSASGWVAEGLSQARAQIGTMPSKRRGWAQGLQPRWDSYENGRQKEIRAGDTCSAAVSLLKE
jgi:hypothetical protein